MNEAERIVVVGGGPVGLVCAFGLVRQGIPVTLVEAQEVPEKDERAASLHPSTLEILDDLGLAEAILPLGLRSQVFKFWDRLTGQEVAAFDLNMLKDDTRFPFVLQYEQYKFAAFMQRLLRTEIGFETRFNAAFTSLSQDNDEVTARIRVDGGEEALSCRFLIGADGGRSAVRKALGVTFEGFTYRERFVKICTSFDFQNDRDFAIRNYFSDPDEWCNLFKVLGDDGTGLWRAIYPVPPDESDGDATTAEAAERRMQRFFPRGEPYDIRLRKIYTVSQRVAETFNVGRAALAGDAAHVNNPIGGLGMNSGIHDAANLASKLGRIWRGEAGLEILDHYTRQRRTVAHRFVQSQTIRNKKTLEERDPEVRRQHLDELRRIAESPAAAHAFMLNTSLIESVRTAAAIP